MQSKKIRDTKGTFHAKMGSIKDRNGMDLTEAEDIKKRGQECTEELYKKDLHDPDNHDGVITHLEPDILECEIKWVLGSTSWNQDCRESTQTHVHRVSDAIQPSHPLSSPSPALSLSQHQGLFK